MMQLAAKQKMNTDIRRAIFCVIMSGEDYIDAFEQLLSLNLQGKQVFSIIWVQTRFNLICHLWFLCVTLKLNIDAMEFAG